VNTRSSLGLIVLSLMAIQLPACVSYEPAILIPAIALSAEEIRLSESLESDIQLDFGLELGINESDSLFNVEVLPGVRVRNVAANGAADSAGIQVGDIILSINSLETNHPDTVLAIQQRSAEVSYEFQIQRNTLVFAASVIARSINENVGPIELFRIDPIATRAGYRTELVTIGIEQELAAARVVELFPNSPLPQAQIEQNDLILALNGVYLNSAQDLVTRLVRDHELGEEVILTIYDGNDVIEQSVRLWDPGRRVSRINLGPLLQYESVLNPASESFSLLDFWLFAVYSYSRMEGERSHSILGLFNITSDYGELTELNE